MEWTSRKQCQLQSSVNAKWLSPQPLVWQSMVTGYISMAVQLPARLNFIWHARQIESIAAVSNEWRQLHDCQANTTSGQASSSWEVVDRANMLQHFVNKRTAAPNLIPSGQTLPDFIHAGMVTAIIIDRESEANPYSSHIAKYATPQCMARHVALHQRQEEMVFVIKINATAASAAVLQRAHSLVFANQSIYLGHKHYDYYDHCQHTRATLIPYPLGCSAIISLLAKSPSPHSATTTVAAAADAACSPTCQYSLHLFLPLVCMLLPLCWADCTRARRPEKRWWVGGGQNVGEAGNTQWDQCHASTVTATAAVAAASCNFHSNTS